MIALWKSLLAWWLCRDPRRLFVLLHNFLDIALGMKHADYFYASLLAPVDDHVLLGKRALKKHRDLRQVLPLVPDSWASSQQREIVEQLRFNLAGKLDTSFHGEIRPDLEDVILRFQAIECSRSSTARLMRLCLLTNRSCAAEAALLPPRRKRLRHGQAARCLGRSSR